jgi:hypothetical protein
MRTLRLLGFASLVSFSAPFPAVAADDESEWNRDFGSLTVGVSGGFQYWSLSDLEAAIDERAAAFASDGYALEPGAYSTTFAYALDLQFRFSKRWFARTQLEWTRLSVDDRDRQSLQFLGARERTPVSLTAKTQVQTRPVLFSVGIGRSWRGPSLRWALVGGLVIAPLKVVDEIGVFLEADTVSEVEATGTGLGADLALSCDYFTDSNMNLFAEIFGRAGSGDVKLTDDVWESTILPGTRRVNLDGIGIRLGFRWI